MSHPSGSYAELFAALKAAGHQVTDPAEYETEFQAMLAAGATINQLRAFRGLPPRDDGDRPPGRVEPPPGESPPRNILEEFEWQLAGTDQWLFGKKVRGVVRKIVAEVFFDGSDTPGEWVWRALPAKGRVPSFQEAVAAAEDSLINGPRHAIKMIWVTENDILLMRTHRNAKTYQDILSRIGAGDKETAAVLFRRAAASRCGDKLIDPETIREFPDEDFLTARLKRAATCGSNSVRR